MNEQSSPRVLPSWVRRFIDIPFTEHGRDWDGCDCWGLYRLAFHDRFGIWLPSFGEAYTDVVDGKRIGAAIEHFGTRSDIWREVEPGSEKMGDGLLMSGYFPHEGRWHKANMHVGFMVIPGVILHTEHGVDAALGFYRDDRRFWSRLIGIYRYTPLEQAQGAGLPH